MRRTKQKRALALLLSLAAVLSLTVLPGHASRFQDVPDQRVSLAADTLSALGVVSGTGAGKFSPNGYLTRAQLCKMAVEIMGMGEQAEAQAYRTIFTDMKRHWARGYVNLAATTEVSEGTRLMLGLGNGTFGPDRNVTYQEAVTVVLRILGYGAQANRAWPHSAVETAAQLGLDKDLKIANPAGPITRGQTALLFYHMLFTAPQGEEGAYAEKLGKTEKDAILLAADATVNGQSGWVVLVHGGDTEPIPAAAPVDTALLGKRGTALLDKEGRFVTLIPDDSTSVTAPVERKEGYYLYLSGKRYALSENTPVYTGSTYSAEKTTYGEYMTDLSTGTVVTLYLDSQGRATGLYHGKSSAETRFVIVGSGGGSYDAFRSLTGSERNYTIRKNGVPASMDDIKRYDVATYDPVAKVLNVCDVRLACVYENAAPSAASPSKITAANGNKFDVLADAISSFSGYKLGDKLTLMLTYDGKVAGVLPKGERSVPCLALGVLEGEGGFRLLGCDLTLTGGVVDEAHKREILNASSERRDTLALTPAGTQTSAKLDTANMTLDGIQVDPGVRVYERTAGGLVARSLAELPSGVTAAQYHKGGSGTVDLIIVNGYSNEGYKYGRIDMLSGYELVKLSSGAPGPDGVMTKDKWTIRAVQGELKFNGETISNPGNGYYSSGYAGWNESIPSIVYLQAIKNVPSSAFYTQGGDTYVRTSEGVYPVDDDVPCFNGAASSYTQSDTPPDWVRLILNSGGTYTGDLGVEDGTVWSPNGVANVVMFKSLGECRSFSDTVTVYIDGTSQRVRVVEAGA